MNTIRSLTTFAAATALAGAIGIAYAQTTTDPAPTATPSTGQTTPMAAPNAPAAPTGADSSSPSSATTPSTDSSNNNMNNSAPASSTDGSAPLDERAPKADRG